MDRPAGTAAGFGYSAALRDSKLTWNAATLDRFLSAPAKLVPGTLMAVSLPAKSDRDNLLAYFTALGQGTYREPAPPAKPPGRDDQGYHLGDAPKSGQDWKLDAPGRVHHVQVAQLPPPYETRASNKSAEVDPAAGDAHIKLPPGFGRSTSPRTLHAAQHAQRPQRRHIPGRSQRRTHQGVASVGRWTTRGQRRSVRAGTGPALWHGVLPAGGDPRWLYVAENGRVVRYAYRMGDTQARGLPEVVVPALAPEPNGGHVSRDLGFSLDGKLLYVSVGSQSNVAEEMKKKTVAQAQAWEKTRLAGAAWDSETQRAAVLEFDAEKPAAARFYATGLRNCVGLTIHPVTGDVWCTVNERDLLGDDLVPDYSTRVPHGAFFGWPWYYLGDHEDPRLKDQRPDLRGKITVPDVLYQAHSAPITLTFYPPNQGAAAFPRYWGDGFAVMRGSWNRASRTGHKVVRVA